MILPLALFATAVQFPGARPPSNDIRIENRVPVPMRDGVTLYADVYRPVTDGKYPVLVSRTPYSTERAPNAYSAAVYFARRGYVFVFQDVRGRHESEGKWEPYRNEASDGYDTIEWAAKQPWSNGKVGMQGGSYLGHVQWWAASAAPPHLVTIFPALAAVNIYKDRITLGGAWKLAPNFGWGAVRQESRIMQNTGPHTMPDGPDGLAYEKVIWHLPLMEMPKLLGRNPTFYYDWIRHPDYDSYWQSLDVSAGFERIAGPVHTFGGWFDMMLKGTLDGYSGMSRQGKTETARQKSHMIVGPWGHGSSRKFGDLDFGDHANIDTHAVELRWFDYWLKGIDNGLEREPPVKIFVMGRNQWRYEKEYPLARAENRKLYLHSGGRANTSRGDGRLSWDPPPAASKPDRYRYDPENPVPSLGGNDCCGVPSPAGPRDQRPIENRSDILVYTSDVLDREIEVTGPLRVVLYASSDAVDTDFGAKLIDVYPDGRSLNVAEGILRARYRESLSQPKLLERGKVYELTIEMPGTSNVFLVGHRIRMNITSSHFPQFDRNPNTGDPFGMTANTVVANQSVYHTATQPSHVILPVVR
jgi:putative CocE/NonD family hydrolase